MTTALKALLDDVAADAVEDLRIDVGEVVARSRRRRFRLRTAGSALMVAAAAVLAAALVVPVVLTATVEPADRTKAVVGIPNHWYFAPAFVPPVTRAPMEAASMLLAGDGSAPVLVSADATRYARLPWGDEAGLAALSRDGTRAAWTERDGDVTVVQLLRLRDGRRVEARLPVEWRRPLQVVWAGGQVYVSAEGGTGRVDGVSGRVTELCDCSAGKLGTDGQDRLANGGRSEISLGTALPDSGIIDYYPPADLPSWSRYNASAQRPVWSFPESSQLVVDPAGKRYVYAMSSGGGDEEEWSLTVPGGRRTYAPLNDYGEVAEAEPLAWTEAGFVVRLTTGIGGSQQVTLRLMDMNGDPVRLLSSRMEGANVPVAVAADLVGDRSIPATAPEFPSWDRDRIRYGLDVLFGRSWVVLQFWPVALIAAAAAVLFRRRRRRRRSP